MRTPEFQLVAWTIKFYLQVETRGGVSIKTDETKSARTTAPTTDRKPRR
jgi:hypothetical protein